jgi:hypothetical protein
MKYPYEDLSSEQFERLVVAICQFLLGAGVQGFAAGRDGGRDAKFLGTANLIPSEAAPWSGTVIIQAKHTNGYNQKFSDPDFFSEKASNTVIAKELPRIRKLRVDKALDHYMLFSNRKLTGQGESSIRAHLSKECGLPEQSIYLCGVEQMELWLKRFPRSAEIASIDPVDSPLIVSPDALAEVVEALAKHLSVVSAKLDDVPTARVSYDQKNRLNRMSDEYARDLRRRYLKESQQIREFLSDPQNEDLLAHYTSIVEEFQLNIIAKRKEYQSFDDVLNYLFRLLFGRDPILGRNQGLTRMVVFYMYWNCDLGASSDAQTQ